MGEEDTYSICVTFFFIFSFFGFINEVKLTRIEELGIFVNAYGAILLSTNFKTKNRETTLKEAIERHTSGNDEQFVIICTPTRKREKTMINGVLLDQPNNPYMIHLLETMYEELATCILLNWNYADGEDFSSTLTVVHKVLKYPMKKIHFICN